MMKASRAFVLVLVASAVMARQAAAHEQPAVTAVVVRSYLAVEPGHVRVLVRVPLDLLGDIGFVARQREIQVEASGSALAQALAAAGQWFVLADGRTSLAPIGSRARLTLPSDRSFDTFASALAHIDEAQASPEPVFVDQGFFDAALTFETDQQGRDLYVRLRPNALLPSRVTAALQYMPSGDRHARALVVTSGAGWVPLEPGLTDTASWFLRSGLRRVSTDPRYLLLLLALTLAVGSAAKLWPLVVMVSVGRSAAVVGTPFGLAGLGSWVESPVEAIATAALAVVMLAVLAGLSLERQLGLAAFLGLLSGLVFSFGLQDELPFAAGHRLVGAVSFNLGLEIGQWVVAGAAVAVVARARSSRHLSRLAALMVTALVAHVVWHQAIERGIALWTEGLAGADPMSVLILARWTAGVTIAVVAANWLSRRRRAPDER